METVCVVWSFDSFAVDSFAIGSFAEVTIRQKMLEPSLPVGLECQGRTTNLSLLSHVEVNEQESALKFSSPYGNEGNARFVFFAAVATQDFGGDPFLCMDSGAVLLPSLL